MGSDPHTAQPKPQAVVKIANDVIGVIAAIAAMDVEGISGLSGGLVSGISEKLGKSGIGRGVRVEVEEQSVKLDLFIIVQYGAKIPDVAVRTQSVVKRDVQTMTGLTVTGVNIHVQGVAFPTREGGND